MNLKGNPTPVASNPRGLYSDRISYHKYIHSVHEADERKNVNGYVKPVKSSNQRRFGEVSEKFMVKSSTSPIANAKKTAYVAKVDSPKQNRPSSKIVPSSTLQKCANSTEKCNENLKIESREPVLVDRATRNRMERERRKAVREQTVLNKPLKQWILAADSSSSSLSQQGSDYLEPRLRLESLRAMSKKPASLNWWDKSNVAEDKDVYYNDSSPQETFHPPDGSNSLDNNNNETKGRVKNLWDQRIEEHQKWLEIELKRPKNLHKSWKPSELLSASLLAVKDEQNLNTILSYGSSYSKQPSDPLLTQPINYLELANMKRYATGENFYVEQEPEFRGNSTFVEQVYDPYGGGEGVYSQSTFRNVSQTRNQWQQLVDDNRPPPGQKMTTNGLGQTPPVAKNGHVSRSEYEVQRPKTFETEPRNYQKAEREQSRSRTEVQRAPTSFEVEPRNYQTSEPSRNRASTSPSVYYEQKLVATPEREKQLLVTYLCTHPQVVSSVGITIPAHVRQKFTPSPNTRVELLEVVQPVFYADDNNQIPANYQISRNPIQISAASNVAVKQVGRYEKNPNLSSSHGATPKMAQRIIEQRNVAAEPAVDPILSSSAKKQWKLAEWVEPPPAVNKNDVLLQESNDFDKTVYKSPGESLIAREIRELKEREAELRSSRTELGLQQIEDVIQQREFYQENRDNEPIPLRSAQSYDHLQVVVENGLQQYGVRNEVQKVPVKSGSMDHLHYAAQNSEANNQSYDRQSQTGAADTSTTVMYTRGAPKTLYGQFLNSHHPTSPERNRLMQSFEAQTQLIPAEPQLQQIRNSTPAPRKSECTSIEARIEQEVQELKQREEELRRQREFLMANSSDGPARTEVMVESSEQFGN